MTAMTVNGVDVVADEPTRAPINARGGNPIFWQKVRTLTLADGSTVYGCQHCEYVNVNVLSIRPHLKAHAPKPQQVAVQCALMPARGCPHPLLRFLAAERESRRLSLADLSRLTGHSHTSLSQWERGLRHPGVLGLTDYAAALGFDLVLMRSQQKPMFVADHEQRRAS